MVPAVFRVSLVAFWLAGYLSFVGRIIVGQIIVGRIIVGRIILTSVSRFLKLSESGIGDFLWIGCKRKVHLERK